jgi:hypothetical protein
MLDLLRKLVTWLRHGQPPLDPRSPVRVPVNRGPGDRTLSVAVEEPRDEDRLFLVSRR